MNQTSIRIQILTYFNNHLCQGRTDTKVAELVDRNAENMIANKFKSSILAMKIEETKMLERKKITWWNNTNIVQVQIKVSGIALTLLKEGRKVHTFLLVPLSTK